MVGIWCPVGLMASHKVKKSGLSTDGQTSRQCGPHGLTLWRLLSPVLLSMFAKVTLVI